jgi:heme/copper-type cytochrome/quinol oxidase subunit 2
VWDDHDTYNLDVGGKEEVFGLSIGVILLIVAVVIVVIGAGVACYIRKRNAIQRARGGQLL